MTFSKKIAVAAVAATVACGECGDAHKFVQVPKAVEEFGSATGKLATDAWTGTKKASTSAYAATRSGLASANDATLKPAGKFLHKQYQTVGSAVHPHYAAASKNVGNAYQTSKQAYVNNVYTPVARESGKAYKAVDAATKPYQPSQETRKALLRGAKATAGVGLATAYAAYAGAHAAHHYGGGLEGTLEERRAACEAGMLPNSVCPYTAQMHHNTVQGLNTYKNWMDTKHAAALTGGQQMYETHAHPQFVKVHDNVWVPVKDFHEANVQPTLNEAGQHLSNAGNAVHETVFKPVHEKVVDPAVDAVKKVGELAHEHVHAPLRCMIGHKEHCRLVEEESVEEPAATEDNAENVEENAEKVEEPVEKVEEPVEKVEEPVAQQEANQTKTE